MKEEGGENFNDQTARFEKAPSSKNQAPKKLQT
jgi:hypothetical protein